MVSIKCEHIQHHTGKIHLWNWCTVTAIQIDFNVCVVVVVVLFLLLLFHSKTVTWADDPNSNYKNEDNSTTVYETQNVSNEVPADSYYMDNPESQQIQAEYTTDGTIQPGMETSDPQYQYQYDSQYDNNQYQSSDGAADPNVYSNTDYYENENQYDQYENQQQQQQQQEVISRASNIIVCFMFVHLLLKCRAINFRIEFEAKTLIKI